ncbi:MAG: hypothetical protein ACXWJT_10160 [Xanthobacteraceae bacterium]
MFRRSIAALAFGFVLAATPVRAAETVTPNDAARFLAGMPPSAQSPLAPLTKDRAWIQHAAFFDRAFGQLEQRQISKIRAWSEANITAPRPTMFYMFSGPDFLYANAFFPKATTYVLSALEPVGSVPDLARLSASAGSTLYNVERSLSTILTFSFFITRHMKTDLQSGQVSGTLPILYVFLARSGKTLHDVSMVTIGDDGTVRPAAEKASYNAARGVKITFAGSDGVEKTLYYFSTNLANDGFRVSGFEKFAASLAPGDSFIKSASYLLYNDSFSNVRTFLLNNSAALVQDDSGIPLAYFNRKNWDFHAFGNYLGPISEFPGRYQENVAALFKKSQPIDFGVGYRWRPRESNLMLAVRGETTTGTTAEATDPEPAPPHPRKRRPPPPPPQQLPGRGFFIFR